MSKIIAEVRLEIDEKVAQDMLGCVGYGYKERNNRELVNDLLSILEYYGAVPTVDAITKQNLQSCGCEYCHNPALIMPASYLGGGSKEFRKWVQEAQNQKKFLFQVEREKYTIIDKCPFCHYKFTEEDYDDFREEDD